MERPRSLIFEPQEAWFTEVNRFLKEQNPSPAERRAVSHFANIKRLRAKFELLGMDAKNGAPEQRVQALFRYANTTNELDQANAHFDHASRAPDFPSGILKPAANLYNELVIKITDHNPIIMSQLNINPAVFRYRNERVKLTAAETILTVIGREPVVQNKGSRFEIVATPTYISLEVAAEWTEDIRKFLIKTNPSSVQFMAISALCHREGIKAGVELSQFDLKYADPQEIASVTRKHDELSAKLEKIEQIIAQSLQNREYQTGFNEVGLALYKTMAKKIKAHIPPVAIENASASVDSLLHHAARVRLATATTILKAIDEEVSQN